MESLGTSPKQNDGGDGRPQSVAAKSRATGPETLTEKRAMKKERKKERRKKKKKSLLSCFTVLFFQMRC